MSFWFDPFRSLSIHNITILLLSLLFFFIIFSFQIISQLPYGFHQKIGSQVFAGFHLISGWAISKSLLKNFHSLPIWEKGSSPTKFITSVSMWEIFTILTMTRTKCYTFFNSFWHHYEIFFKFTFFPNIFFWWDYKIFVYEGIVK